ncbi:DUF5655 domain-containing protein [bacterium]|nr:DUF5655 domain-containing protein [bacterium]
MSDIKLFKTQDNSVQELISSSVDLEKSLQNLLEKNLETFLGVRLLASEYVTGKKHKGRIDTIGLDENNCPVIIEYKRTRSENVINQGLFYLDWLMDHQSEFELLVVKKLEQEIAKKIDWSGPRLICIALDYSNYDEHAVNQIDRNIQLIRYRKYEQEYLLLELVNTVTTSTYSKANQSINTKPFTNHLEQAPLDMKKLYDNLQSFIEDIGDDVALKALKYYTAFTRIKNFACVQFRPQKKQIFIFLKVTLEDVPSEYFKTDFAKDIANNDYFGSSTIEIKISNLEDLEKAKPLIIKSYENS